MLGIYRTGALVRETDRPIDTLSLDDAYAVQERVVAMRIADGERHVGYKVGCTSEPIRRQFGLDQPVFAHVMAPAVHESGVRLPASRFVGCAVEPEFVFRVEAPLAGRGLSDDVLRGALSGPAPGIEVHNYRFFHGTPTSQELIASNALHAAQVVGRARGTAVDLVDQPVELLVDGEVRVAGRGGDILDAGPLASVRWLVEQLTGRGRRLEVGEIVVPGSPVALVRVRAGERVTARFGDLGSCEALFA